MQLLSAILVVATASVASAAVASPNLVDRGLNGPYCDRGSVDGGVCEAYDLHGYCCTTVPSPGYVFLRDAIELEQVIGCGSNGGRIYCAF
ncbi:hypothetical protein E4U30_004599 [Claviceps sp. LM220 group G6]|nr:hypothetical protein E4U15_003828 [Claviceps sp. LM218 group G6]KAG6093001.1 hypothetical protein E4U31_006969 [Claviceps sp. LM219 group G6]KAG6093151.1 hypothetical protein E4U30_004599 [Claviceps sp. LM220 group G6]